MKLKSLLLALSLSLCTQAFGQNLHVHPKADSSDKKLTEKAPTAAGYCEIEIINDSLMNVTVYGTFDDGSTVDFNIYRYEYPHYIACSIIFTAIAACILL